MARKSLLTRVLYLARDLRSRALFEALRKHARGDVLDVGGWDFFATARRKGVPFRTWTTLESDPDRLLEIDDARVTLLHGDGCAMQLADESFDTVLNVQVLEHVFEPIRMVQEIGRVLRRGGCAIFLVPQTSTTHLAPHYYSNFSRYWIQEALRRAGLETVEHRPLGGVWSSAASHCFYFFLQSARVAGMSDPACERNALFYVLFPCMALYALVSLPLCLVLGLGDLSEEPNNHLVVARKPG
jgi:SAM-dependent methyltransferase